MLALDAHTLTERIDSFNASAREQQTAAEHDHIMLKHGTDVLAGEVGTRLADFARRAPRRHEQDLLDAAVTVPRGRVDEQLRELVERWVQEDFEAFRREEADRAAAAWRELATACRTRTEERVNAIRAAAADLFEIHLPAIQVPEVTEEREDFFYLFLHVGSVNEDVERVARRLLPQRIARKRAYRRAHRLLFQSFDKHAGRARWDLTQRVERAAKRFEQLMNDELTLTVQHILTGRIVPYPARACGGSPRATAHLDRRTCRGRPIVGVDPDHILSNATPAGAGRAPHPAHSQQDRCVYYGLDVGWFNHSRSRGCSARARMSSRVNHPVASVS
jgi:hypothetical protein